MTYLVKHQNGTVMGICTNKPGDGNRLPDGSVEVHQYVQDDPHSPDFDAAGVAQIAAFIAAQAEKLES